MKTIRFFPALISGLVLMGMAQARLAGQAAGQSPATQANGAGRAARPAQGSALDERRITMDVVVTDKTGKPVTGLERGDFTLLDNNRGDENFTVEGMDGVTHRDARPAELDAVNQGHDLVVYQRQEVAKFLRQNGGRLAMPTSVFLFTDTGVQVQPRPTTDGNALAATVEKMDLSWRFVDRRGGEAGRIDQFLLSLKLFSEIVESEATKPNRKVVIWVGPGWPLLGGTSFVSTSKAQKERFAAIVEFTRKMREGRISLYSASKDFTLYTEYLGGVKTAREAEAGNLGLAVLATRSGGSVVSTGSDLVGAIERILPEANAYYRLRFDGAPAGRADEYHELKVMVKQAGLTARSPSCYYAQP